MAPSLEIAGDDYTSPPVSNAHFSAPVAASIAYNLEYDPINTVEPSLEIAGVFTGMFTGKPVVNTHFFTPPSPSSWGEEVAILRHLSSHSHEETTWIR